MRKKIEFNKEKLEGEYKELGSSNKVAKLYGVATDTITRHLMKFGISINKKNKKIEFDIRLLKNQYKELKSTEKLAKLYNCDPCTIAVRLKKADVKLKEPKFHFSKNKLEKEYKKLKSINQVAKLYKADAGTILRVMQKFGIPQTEDFGKRITKEELETKYLELKSSRKVAKFYGVSKPTILTWISNFNIKIIERSFTVKCSQCEKALRRIASRVKNTLEHFCNRKCYGRWISINRCGEKANAFLDGKGDYYGGNWAGCKKQIRKRDYCCKLCGITQDKNGRHLSVHHVFPFKYFGIKNYKLANCPTNLVCYCIKCHFIIEKIYTRLFHTKKFFNKIDFSNTNNNCYSHYK